MKQEANREPEKVPDSEEKPSELFQPQASASDNRKAPVTPAPEEATKTKNKEAVPRPASQPDEAPKAPADETERTELPAQSPKPSPQASPSHETWNALLQKYVSSTGKVNYKGMMADKAKLKDYLDELAANPPAKTWSREEKLAYWINAYNAFTIKLILDHYPLSSIMDINNGKAWDIQWIRLGDKTYSLNNIENDIIRPRFNEPRIHFAINCAARSCPPLLNQAWEAENLNRLLDQQARSFINNPKYNSISPKAVEISRIFEWYAADFGNIIDYLNQYSDTLINKGAKVSYRDYDWSLNN